eukprot:Skav213141  [mRNA]  locus=scaffold107:474127:475598:+ [translate_table: standard]
MTMILHSSDDDEPEGDEEEEDDDDDHNHGEDEEKEEEEEGHCHGCDYWLNGRGDRRRSPRNAPSATQVSADVVMHRRAGDGLQSASPAGASKAEASKAKDAATSDGPEMVNCEESMAKGGQEEMSLGF